MKNPFFYSCLVCLLFASSNEQPKTSEQPVENKEVTPTEKIISATTEETSKEILIEQKKTELIKEPTVLDYFMALPEIDYFQCDCEEGIKIKERSSYIIKKNINAGYILARDGCGELDLAVVLFRDKTNTRDIIAVDNIWVTGDYFCLTDGRKGLFYLNKSGDWEDVTDELIDKQRINSKLKTSRYVFLYPEKGTTVTILDEDDTDKVLGYLKWRSGRFKFKSK